MWRLSSRMTVAAILLLMTVWIVTAWPERQTSPAVDMRIGTPAPEFALEDADGVAIRLGDYRGQVVMLNFWATRCTGCKLELPWLTALQEEYEHRGLVSIGVALDDEGWSVVKPFLATHPVGYHVVVGDWALADRYDVVGLPLPMLIDREGKVRAAHLGVIDREAWATEIQRVLDL